jgi:hypothetical protein
VLLDLAADAIGVSGATRQSPIEFEGIRARYLPEAVAHTRRSTTRASTHCAQWRCCTAVSTPDSSTKCTGGGTTWYWSLEALAAYVGAAADRIVEPDQSVPTHRRRTRHHPRRRRSLIVQRLLNVAAPRGNHRGDVRACERR